MVIIAAQRCYEEIARTIAIIFAFPMPTELYTIESDESAALHNPNYTCTIEAGMRQLILSQLAP